MDLQTGDKSNNPGSNYGVAAVQRQVFTYSNLTAFIINKEITGRFNDSSFTGYRWNRVAGLEFNFAGSGNRWTGKTFYHQSLYPDADGSASTLSANLVYSAQKLRASIVNSWVGKNYISETGYIRRDGYLEINPSLQYKFFPSGNNIANHGPGCSFDILFDPSLNMTDRETRIFYQAEWLNRAVFVADLKEIYVKLRFPFDPTNSGGFLIPAGNMFNWIEGGASFTSDIRKPFYLILSNRYGGFYGGTKLTLAGELNYRLQPYGSLAIVSSYNDIGLKQPYNSAKLVLIGPRLDITFTDKLFLTSFVQYNNQIDNINLNFRFQWRYAPVSDLYIVFTQNSFPDDWRIKDRGLVFKLSYWFN